MTRCMLVAVAGASLVASGLDVDLASARIETACATNESQRTAAQELEKHLALIAGNRAGGGSQEAVFVVGRPAPGFAAAKEHESHAREVGGRIYFWGDDSGARSYQRWGTLFAVYGFLEKALGVRWVEPGDRGIVLSRRPGGACEGACPFRPFGD